MRLGRRNFLTAAIGANPPTPHWAKHTFLLPRGNLRALAGGPVARADLQRVLAGAAWSAQHKSAHALLT